MTRATVTILEGLDGAGKTYAAGQRIRKEQRATGKTALYVHNGPPDHTTSGHALFAHYLGQLRTAVANRKVGRSTIIDRSWPSEVVYGSVYRDGPLLTPRQVRRLERFAKRHDIITIFVDAPDDTRMTRILDRGEKWFPPDQIALRHLYTLYFQSHAGWITVSSSLA